MYIYVRDNTSIDVFLILSLHTVHGSISIGIQCGKVLLNPPLPLFFYQHMRSCVYSQFNYTHKHIALLASTTKK